VVQLLLEHDDTSLNFETKMGHSALFQATLFRTTTKGYAETVEVLLRQKHRLNEENTYGETVVFRAACRGHDNVLAQLFTTPEVDPSVRDRFGRTLLWVAAANGQVNTVNLLIHQYRCDPNVADNCGRTPLRIAIKKGHCDVLTALSGEQHNSGYVDEIQRSRTTSTGARGITFRTACDICTALIRQTERHYHCMICADGDWDICVECQEFGMSCLEDCHKLVKREKWHNRWTEVD
jgi:hypothetical protein